MEVVHDTHTVPLACDKFPAATILKYTYAGSEVYATIQDDLLDKLAEKTTEYHHGQPGVEDQDVSTINGNRKSAYEAAVVKGTGTGDESEAPPKPLEKSAYLQLPHSESGEQLATRGKVFQGEAYNKPVAEADFKLKRQVYDLDECDFMLAGVKLFGQMGFVVVWELEVILPSAPTRGEPRARTPVRDDETEKLRRRLQDKMVIRGRKLQSEG